MITSELVSYIKKQKQNDASKDLIISKLIGAGWHIEDINEGFLNIEKELKPEVSLPEIKKEIYNINPIVAPIENNKEVVDKYHEPIIGDNIFEVEKPIIIKISNEVKEPQKVEVLKTEEPKLEIPKIEIKTEPIKIDIQKVWTPMSVPVKENIQTKNIDSIVKTQTTQIETQNKELQAGKRDESSPVVVPIILNKKEELLPNLMPKMVVNSFGSVNKDTQIKTDNFVAKEESPINSYFNNLPKMAMISSYQKDLSSFNKIKEEIFKKKGNKKFKIIAIAIATLIIALLVWLFAVWFVSVKNINFSFIKKDPKILLLSNSNVLSSLKSYKTETNIDISSPSFSNITYGLISGEAVQSNDKDSISINTLGTINQDTNSLISDNFVTIKGSILPNYINTDIKNNGSNLFVSVPDLSGIMKGNAPESSVVKINEDQFSLIPSLFSPDIEAYLNKINIYKILSSGIPSYINSDTLGAYNELINNVEIIEKGQDNIKGMDTYHYSINIDRQLSKNILSKISDNFVLNLSNDDKDKLAGILGAITVDSFDVWVGKGDNNIYQYSVVIDIPLSKIIGFEDKSIGDNKVSISWKTTYYDFDISNNIIMPDNSIPVTDFVNKVKETEMKNEVSSFKQLATNLFSVEKTYGKKSNTSGSCMNPISGSLFSPTGHSKSSTTAISSISIFLNKILGITNGIGSCYSTSKAWSFAIPISSNYDPASVPVEGDTPFFCVDSTGFAESLSSLPTRVVCK